MNQDFSYYSNQTPYVDISTGGYKRSSEKYTYDLQNHQSNNPKHQISQFSPYKQTYLPHKQNNSVYRNGHSRSIKCFSPYSVNKLSPPKRYLKQYNNYEYRSNLLAQTLKQTDYKILQHNAMTRQHIIEQLTLLNHQLKDQIIFYKQTIAQSQQNLRLSKEKLRLEYKKLYDKNVLNQQIIEQQKEDIRVLLYKNSLLEQKQQSALKQQYKSHQKHKQKQRQRQISKQRQRQRQRIQQLSSRQKSNKKQTSDQSKLQNTNLLKQIEQVINRQYSSNRYLSQFICCKRDIKQNIECMIKRLSKLESLIRSIFEMRYKINKEKDNDLKKTWRWIKATVQSSIKYKRLKEYEPKISKKLKIQGNKNIQQIIQQLLKS